MSGKVTKTCGECEYFDRHYGDCLRPGSPRFQTGACETACSLFHPDSTATRQAQAQSREDEGEANV